MKFLDVYAAAKPLHLLESTGQVTLYMRGGVSVTKRGYENPMLILQTTEFLNAGVGGLVVTLVGYGSKILDRHNFKITPLILIGLTSVAARLLLEELKILKF